MALLNGEILHWQITSCGYLTRQFKFVFVFLFFTAEQLTAISKTNVIPLGSFMPIWAAVEQKSHQPLLLLMEECVAASTPELRPDSQVHPIISNKGYDSDTGSSLLWLFEGRDSIFFFSAVFWKAWGETQYFSHGTIHLQSSFTCSHSSFPLEKRWVWQ